MFAIWTAISGVSCVLGRRTWLNFGLFTLYPNLYVIFVAPPGGGKTTAIDYMDDKIFKFLTPPPNLIAQSGTPQAIVKSMRQVQTTPDGKEIANENCTGFLVAEELVTFLNRRSYDQGMAEFLTKMYNCPSTYEHITITRGEDSLRNVWFGMLGGTTVNWLRETLPSVAIGGGLTSRMIFVYHEVTDSDLLCPRPQLVMMTEERLILLDSLIKRLQVISTMKGEFSATENAWNEYDREYKEWRNWKHPWASDESLAGYWRRRMNNYLKLGMIFSASERDDRVIELKHFLIASKFLKESEENMKKVFEQITASKEGSDAQMVLRVIEQQREGILEQKLLQLFGHKINVRELKDVLDTLEKGGKIVKKGPLKGGHFGYLPVEKKKE